MIDYKPGKVKVFPIGHSSSCSETFFPTFAKNNKDEGWFFVDMAGLKDSGGDIMDFTNQFINAKIFQVAK